MEQPFKVGQKLTIFSISESMAHTQRSEVTVKSVYPDGPKQTGYGNKNTEYGTITYRGKRKEYYLSLREKKLVFDGWDVPFVADSDGGNFSGNACLNLVGDKAVVRDYIENKSLLPVSDDTKACIIVYASARETLVDRGELLYPEIETHHAVVNRMKEAMEPLEA